MLVAIDAGHGHNTPGKRCPDDSMREHDFNGNVATKVCEILNKNGIETYRSDDITGNTDVPLITRTNNINSKKAIICVSIHANAFTGQWNDANGIETYIIARGGEAEKIANIVQNKLIEYTGRRNRGVKVSNLHMCRETEMPAILCECGFMDNREEAELLKSEEYRTKCAEAIAEGILEYLNITPVDDVKVTEETKATEQIKDEGGSLEMARVYQNGSTPEPVYADTALTKKIGELNPRETAEYLSIDNDRPLVRYKIDGTSTFKVGYVKWKGGCK